MNSANASNGDQESAMDKVLEERLKGVEDELRRFTEVMERLGRDLERPINAVRDGYYEAALTNAGSIIETMLRDIWRREGVKGEEKKKTIDQLFNVVKEQAQMDRLVQDYVRDIQLVRNRAAHGEEIVVEDCLEALRKLAVILEWYFRTYVEAGDTEAADLAGQAEGEAAAPPTADDAAPGPPSPEREPRRLGRPLAVVAVIAVVAVAASLFLYRSRMTPLDPLDPATWQISDEETATFDAINRAVLTYQKTKRPGRLYRDYDAALGQINGLIARGVTDPVLFLYRGRCFYDKHEYEQAEVAFATAEDEDFRIWHVKALIRANQLERAEAEFRDFKQVAKVDDFSEEIAEVEEALAELGDGSIPFDVWLRLAELEDEGVSGEAAVLSLGRLAEKTSSAELEVMRAGAVWRSDPDQALVHLERALELEPGHRKALEAVVDYWNRKGEHGTTITYLKEIVERHGADAGTAYNLACAYALTGDTESALNWLTTALELGFKDFSHLRGDSDLDSIRGDVRYEELLYRYDR